MIFRFRDELREGEDVETALVETMTHAGRSVIVSGSTVAVGLLSMVILPLPFIRSIGIGGMLIPAVSVLAAITLLPALLATLGTRINSVRAAAEAASSTAAIPRTACGAAGQRSSCAGRSRSRVVGLAIVGAARLLRAAAEPERGAGEGLPGQRATRSTAAPRWPPPGISRGRDEAVRRARRARRDRDADRRPSCGRRPASPAAVAPAATGARARQPRRGVPDRRRRGEAGAQRRSSASATSSKGTGRDARRRRRRGPRLRQGRLLELPVRARVRRPADVHPARARVPLARAAAEGGDPQPRLARARPTGSSSSSSSRATARRRSGACTRRSRSSRGSR